MSLLITSVLEPNELYSCSWEASISLPNKSLNKDSRQRLCIFLSQKAFFSTAIVFKIWCKCHTDDRKMSFAICNLNCRRTMRIMKLWFHNLFQLSCLPKVNLAILHNFILCIVCADLQLSGVKSWRKIKKNLNCSSQAFFSRKKKRSVLVLVFEY